MEPILDHLQIPEYGPNYYAVYFKDLEGIKYEVICKMSEEDQLK